MILQADDEKDSEQWDQIKDFVGGRNKPAKHPLVQEAERMKMRQPQHMDEGGPVLPNVPQGTMPDALAANAPPPAAPPPPPMDAATNAQATDVMGGVTPETIQRLVQSINQQSQQGQIGAEIAGIGDAIQAAGGVHGEHMKEAEDAIRSNRDLALKVPGEMANIGKERFGISKELGGDEPTSRRSYVAQQANLPLLSKMGFTPQQVKAMPASLIDGIRGGAITREEALARINQTAAFQKSDLDLKRMQLEASTEGNKAQREIEKERLGAEKEKSASEIEGGAAKTLAGQGFFKSLLDAVPGTAGHAARNVLSLQSQGLAPVGPYGPTTTRGTKTYEWVPETGKYHLKQ